jgi:prepilin-type N-terminal cleavage/methylation domain-containing protein
MSATPRTTRNPRRRGLSLIEMLVSLAISALLLTGVMVGLDASFYAYAAAAESASTQSSSRLVMQRLIQMIRTATLHDAYDPANVLLTLGQPAAGPVKSVGIQMVTAEGKLLKVWWAVNTAYNNPDVGDLNYSLDGSATTPLLEQVSCQRNGPKPYIFTLASRSSDSGLLLSRATVDLTVNSGADATLTLESVHRSAPPIRLISSTMPRRNMD